MNLPSTDVNWRRTAAVLCVFSALAAVPARAWLFGRSKVLSRWTEKPVAVDGGDDSWDVASAFEEDGLSVLARNDAENLYLLVTGHTREAHDQLSGEAHQDLTLWFVGADGKTRQWGARIPYSHRSPLTNALRDPAGLDPEPEYVHYQGTAVSSDSLPGDVEDKMAAAGRRPIWELKIPMKRLSVSPKGAVAIDFILNAPPAGARRPSAASHPRPPDNGDGGEGGRRGKRGSRDAADSGSDESAWNAQSYGLSVRLALDPALQPR